MVAERREIEIALRSKSAEASADKLTGKVKGIGEQADRSESSMSKLSKAAAAVGAALATAQIQKYADAWINVNNRLSAATSGALEFQRAQQGVISIAQQAGVDIGGVADAYSRIAQSTSELGISQERILDVTRKTTLALKAGGATGSETSSVMIQLGQALGSGALQGDELRSILEASIPITKALAKEFNATTGQLKTLGSEGKLTASRVVRALENMDDKALTFTKNISDGFTEVSNAITVYVGQLDESIGVSASLSKSLSDTASNIDKVVEGATALAVLLGAKLAGSFASSTAASLANFAASNKLLASDALLLKSKQTLAAQQAAFAIQTKNQAMLALQVAANETRRGIAITNLARANSAAIATQSALTAATNAYTAAAGRASIAARGLTGAVALLGGPVGIALIAAASIAYFVTQADKAETSADKYAAKVRGLTGDLDGLEQSQNKANIRLRENLKISIASEIEKATKALKEQEALVVDIASSQNPMGFETARLKSEEMRAELEKLKQSLFELESQTSKGNILGDDFISDKAKQDVADLFSGSSGADLFGGGGDASSASTGGSSSGGESKDNGFESLQARLKLETQAIMEEAEVRRAFAEGEINKKQLDEELALQGIYYQYEGRRMAIMENEKLTAEQKTALLAELAEQEIAAEQSKQDQLTGAAKEGADARTEIMTQEQMATKNMLINTAVAAFNLTQNANQQMTKEQKKQAKRSIYIQTAAAIARAYGENNFYVASGMALFLAGMQLKQLNSVDTAAASAPPSSGFNASSAAPPTVENQSQNRVINITGLEGYGDDQPIPLTVGGLRDLLSSNEDVSIAINEGQQGARRIGAI